MNTAERSSVVAAFSETEGSLAKGKRLGNMERGWIRLWRKSLDKGWLKNRNVWTVWCWCLMKASHKECTVIVGNQEVHLKPGEFVF